MSVNKYQTLSFKVLTPLFVSLYDIRVGNSKQFTKLGAQVIDAILELCVWIGKPRKPGLGLTCTRRAHAIARMRRPAEAPASLDRRGGRRKLAHDRDVENDIRSARHRATHEDASIRTETRNRVYERVCHL